MHRGAPVALRLQSLIVLKNPTSQHTWVIQEETPTSGGFQVIPSGLEPTPTSWQGKALLGCILEGLYLSGRVL
ncbi:MAG: hypothetical protein MUO67_23710 [Anaerolineales bacterium]|nr:hypothetical protein [Anaerolineales bacterium]